MNDPVVTPGMHDWIYGEMPEAGAKGEITRRYLGRLLAPHSCGSTGAETVVGTSRRASPPGRRPMAGRAIPVISEPMPEL